MPISFDITVDNGTATYSVIGSADKQIVIDTAEDAARYVYPIRWQLKDENDEPIPFDDLTVDQQKAIIAKEFKYVMMEYAKTYFKLTAVDTARDAAALEAEVKYDLG